MKHLFLTILLCGAVLAGPVFGAETPPPAGPATEQDAEQETGYWLSTSGKRHNSKCRYYKKSKGIPCGSKDGTACKACGG